MKLLLAAIGFFAAVSVRAQYTPAMPAENAMQTQILTRTAPSRSDLLTVQAPRPNEFRRGHVTYSGSVVELIKTRDPLQMVNPFAPPEFGSAADNTVIDPISGRGTGLKLFAIQF